MIRPRFKLDGRNAVIIYRLSSGRVTRLSGRASFCAARYADAVIAGVTNEPAQIRLTTSKTWHVLSFSSPEEAERVYDAPLVRGRIKRLRARRLREVQS